MIPGPSTRTKAEVAHGAGILLYMTRVEEGKTEIEFVLGQEDYAPGWAQGGCWSAFEGGRKDDEAVERTAAREFVEETAGSIAINGCRTVADIETMLVRRQYALKITVNRASASKEARLHVYYVVRIPWGTPTAVYFRTVRQPLSALYQLCCNEQVAREKCSARGGTKLVTNHKQRVHAVNQAYAALPYFLQTHAALRVSSSPSVDRVHVSVQPDYLEKREVQAFPMHTIEYMLGSRETRPIPRGVRFRYCFIPVIKATIRHLHAAANTHR